MVAKKLGAMEEGKEDSTDKAAEKRSLMKRRKDEFAEKGKYVAIYGSLKRKIECASMCTDHLLNQKRDRLRKLLLAEEENYAKEYVTLCQAAGAAKAEERRKLAKEIKQRLENERQQLAEMRLHQLKIQDCEPARPIRSKIALETVKMDQLWQIKEKYALEEAKREEERMYHDLMIKNLIEMKERDEEEARILWRKQRETKETFIEQMKWKQKKEETEKQLKDLEKKQMEDELERIRQEEEKEIQERRRRNAEKIAEYKEYLAKDREIRERRQKEEEEIDRAFNKLMQIEEEQEKLKIGITKEKLRREMDNYIKSVKELQRMRDLEEKKNEEFLEELNSKIRAQQDANRARVRDAKQELFTNVLKERTVQVKEKREKEREEEESRNREIQLLNLQIEQQRRIREEYERKCSEKRQKYGEQLKEQMREFEEAKNRQKKEEEEFIRQTRLREEERRREIEDILANSTSLPPHPMKVHIMTNQPHFGNL